jgi:hypothetical protein
MKPQPKAQVIYLRLDSNDVEGDQIRYLASVLRRHDGQPGNFSVRFQYDVDGTSHWDGKLFVIDFVDGVCHLRLADLDDTGSSNPRTSKRRFLFDNEQHWKRIRNKIASSITPKDLASIIVTFEQPFEKLQPTELQSALRVFQVADVMFI